MSRYPGRTSEQKHADLLKMAAAMCDQAKLIKLADRLHNLSKMKVWASNRQRRYASRTIELLEALKPWPSESLAKQASQPTQAYA